MRLILSIIFFSLILFISGPVQGQDVRQNEIVVISGEKFVLHQVQTGETIYSLTKKYKVDQSELEKFNPELSKGPSIGDILKIPYKEGADISILSSQKRGAPDGFLTHKIQSRRETAYFIAREYGITVEELNQYNQDIKRFRKGKTLRIPYWESDETEQNKKEPASDSENTINTQNIKHQVVSGETLYSLSKKYGVSEDEILRLNPGAENLKAGSTILIPATRRQVENVVAEKPNKLFDGRYFEHIIESGETLWGTTRRYNVSEAELKALNPILNTGFPAGAVIKIPVYETQETIVKPINSDAFLQYEVQKGETLFGISKANDISILDLKKYNPVLDHRNLVAGEIILIPIVNEEVPIEEEGDNIVIRDELETETPDEDFYSVDMTIEIPEDCQPDYSGTYRSKTYKVALFLPLFLEANDTLNREDPVLDSTIFSNENEELLIDGITAYVIDTTLQDTTIEFERKVEFKSFYRNSENFVQFYEGVLLALQRLNSLGVKVELEVFDTQQNPDSVRKFISKPEFLQTDLIVGPIYPEVQREVSQISAKNRIPMVSPLASGTNLINTNPYYYQVNPSRDYLAVQTAEMVAEEYYNSNIIILQNGEYQGTAEERVVELLQEKFVNAGVMSQRDGVNFTFYDFKKEGAFGLRRIMSNTKENVVYIPSSDEGSLSIAISNVNNLASDYSITLIGTHRFPNYSSIQLDHYHNLKLEFVAPYWIDYELPETIDFIERFKGNFGTEPNNFGVQGYDVTLYFLEVMTSLGNDFTDCLPYFHTNLVQGNYHFEKFSQFGGYMNHGVSVIRYTKDYEVKRERVKGQPRLVVAGMGQ